MTRHARCILVPEEQLETMTTCSEQDLKALAARTRCRNLAAMGVTDEELEAAWPGVTAEDLAAMQLRPEDYEAMRLTEDDLENLRLEAIQMRLEIPTYLAQTVQHRLHGRHKKYRSGAILQVLAKNGPQRPAQIAQGLERPRNNIYEALYRLRRQGLIRKDKSGRYHLTPEGRRVLKEL